MDRETCWQELLEFQLLAQEKWRRSSVNAGPGTESAVGQGGTRQNGLQEKRDNDARSVLTFPEQHRQRRAPWKAPGAHPPVVQGRRQGPLGHAEARLVLGYSPVIARRSNEPEYFRLLWVSRMPGQGRAKGQEETGRAIMGYCR